MYDESRGTSTNTKIITFFITEAVSVCLCRISNHVQDPEECRVLISLLLPFVSAAKYKVCSMCGALLVFTFGFNFRDTRTIF